MADLYRPLSEHLRSEPTGHLPMIADLGDSDLQQLALAGLKDLLVKTWRTLQNETSVDDEAKALSYFGVSDLTNNSLKAEQGGTADLRSQLEQLNLTILERLTVAKPGSAAAYQLGATLSETCSPPPDLATFIHRFHRRRLATLQGWLAHSDCGIAPPAADIVSRSLGHWSAWLNANEGTLRANWAGGTRIPDPARASGGRRSGLARLWPRRSKTGDGHQGVTVKYVVVAALHAQSRPWRGLLGGEIDPAAQPSVDAWIQAGEEMARTARQIAGRVLRHFWIAIAIALAAIGGLLYLIVANTSNSDITRVWASIVTVAGGLGITGTTFRNSAQRIGASLEPEVWQAAEVEARAWEATVLPALPMGPIRLHRLRKQGVGAPVVTNTVAVDPVKLVPRSSLST
jgi:hypothetical protein